MKKKNPLSEQRKIKFLQISWTATVWGSSWRDDPSDIVLDDYYNYEVENITDRRVTLGFRICRTTRG